MPALTSNEKKILIFLAAAFLAGSILYVFKNIILRRAISIKHQYILPAVDKQDNLSPASAVKSSLIDINSASEEELVSLPGIGRKTAKRIIESRRARGGFKDIDEFKNLKIISAKKFEKIKDKIIIK